MEILTKTINIVKNTMKLDFMNSFLALFFTFLMFAGIAFAVQCNDSADNENDGFNDFFSVQPNIFNIPNFDPDYSRGCADASDNSEDTLHIVGFTQCSDGVDNDGDGLSDFPADLGCFGSDDELEREPVCYKGFSLQAWRQKILVGGNAFKTHNWLNANLASVALGSSASLSDQKNHVVVPWGKYVVQNSYDRVYSYGGPGSGCFYSADPNTTGFCGTPQCSATNNPLLVHCCSGDWSRSTSVRGQAGEFTKIIPGASNPTPQNADFGAGCQYQHLLDEEFSGGNGFSYLYGGMGTSSSTIGIYNSSNSNQGGKIFVGINDNSTSNNLGSFGYEIWECGPLCGDGFLDKGYLKINYPSLPQDIPAEQCDGPQGVPEHYTCTQQCTLEYVPYCGDGIVNQQSEHCDNGTANNGPEKACSASCTLTVCGDGTIQAPNGNGQTEHCETNSDCSAGEVCSNCDCIIGTQYHSECNAQGKCIQVEGTGTNSCTNNLDCIVCGDSELETGEQCEKGNPADANCTWGQCNQITCKCNTAPPSGFFDVSIQIIPTKLSFFTNENVEATIVVQNTGSVTGQASYEIKDTDTGNIVLATSGNFLGNTSTEIQLSQLITQPDVYNISASVPEFSGEISHANNSQSIFITVSNEPRQVPVPEENIFLTILIAITVIVIVVKSTN